MKIAVIGLGTMGKSIAQNLVEKGFDVLLYDILDEIRNSAQKYIERAIKLQTMANFTTKQNGKRKGVILVVDEIERVKEAEIIVESITENLDAKKSLYHSISEICYENTIFLCNTSCISITKIASFTNSPKKVIGTHFMNPVPLINAVEVIRGMHTSDETVERTTDLITQLGKEYIIVNDYPGFVSNRISHLMMNEAAHLVQDQVAAPEDIDAIFKKCYGHKMGPLETADLIGLDTVVDSLKVLYDSYQDSKFKCCPLLKKMVDAGFLGRKSGKGFFEY